MRSCPAVKPCPPVSRPDLEKTRKQSLYRPLWRAPLAQAVQEVPEPRKGVSFHSPFHVVDSYAFSLVRPEARRPLAISIFVALYLSGAEFVSAVAIACCAS